MTALTLHVSWEEMTTTSHADLLVANRREAEAYRQAITATARLVEQARGILGVPIAVSSGYRGPTLNARVGGSKTSQHMRGEACDFVPVGMHLDWAFGALVAEVDAGRLLVGQILRERSWIHISLGSPWRDPARCGEIGHQVEGGAVVIDRRVPPRA